MKIVTNSGVVNQLRPLAVARLLASRVSSNSIEVCMSVGSWMNRGFASKHFEHPSENSCEHTQRQRNKSSLYSSIRWITSCSMRMSHSPDSDHYHA
jgi:hypothetical protein